MAFAKVEHDEVLDKLFEVFRAKGYDGASMADLADATGLKKASLYHRFPDGKASMANAVLDNISIGVDRDIVQVVQSEKSAEERLDEVLQSMDKLYRGGSVACALRALSHGSASGLFRDKIAAIFRTLIHAFTQPAADFGHDSAQAAHLGVTAVGQIQGTLILSVATADTDLFDAALADIRRRFTSK